MLISLLSAAAAATTAGYYRDPTLHGDTIVFVAEGDLWRVATTGGTASRLTTHPADEASPQLSPDGATVAFSAAYEGGTEVYVMPTDGGPPLRLTWFGIQARAVGWTPDNRVLIATRSESALPDDRLHTIDPVTRVMEPVPLAQAANGAYGDDGTLYFTRFPFQGSHTKRYQGGTAQDVWRFAGDAATEAVNLTPDWAGTDRDPRFGGGRVYFLSDRDGTMNVWSVRPDGSDATQHTHATDYEVRSYSLDGQRIVYRAGADLYLLDLATGAEALVPVRLDSDFDQTREQWVPRPLDWATAAHLSPDGSRIALTARGQAFVVPARQGRLVTLGEPGVRYRGARFLSDGALLAQSDATGEVELWELPANGVGDRTRLTNDGRVLRWEMAPSPDGRWVAHTDKDQRLFLLDTSSRVDRELDRSDIDTPSELAWSEDGRWLAYVVSAPNLARVVRLYDTRDQARIDVTTDRASTYSPSFSHEGDWLYVLTDRHLQTVVPNPWSPLWSEPFFDVPTQVMAVALRPGLRSPFAPADELHPEPGQAEPDDEKDRKRARRKQAAGRVDVVAEGIRTRLTILPLPPGNLSQLSAGIDRLFWLSSDASADPTRSLVAAPIDREEAEPEVLVEDIDLYELSADRKHLLVVKEDTLYVLDTTFQSGDELDDGKVDLSAWRLSVSPRDEWRQMFDEAWRLERDYFYDPKMHGVDWPAVQARYRPLVDRVTDRAELADLVSQMVSELSALHTFVFGGDVRRGDDDVRPGSLGADWVRDEAAGGWRVGRIWATDPDRPELRPPLSQLGSEVAVGEVVTAIDGAPTLSAPDPDALLRGKAGHQVLLHVVGAGPTKGPKKKRQPAERDVVVIPLPASDVVSRRYHEWEYTRRLQVEEKGEGKLGYVHLRAMGPADMAEWMRSYLPVFTRDGLIVDVRHNGGGNIDSWILERLMRKAWMYWSQRVGQAPSWNMQYAFRGHVVVLCDAHTGSDGEAFAEGFRRLGLGKVIGTRTWGGEIWLSMSNVLVDGGIASAAEYGVFGPEGTWLIEGHGVEPDIVVDNLPAETYRGVDAQLDAAIAYLQERIAAEPIAQPTVPVHPDKSGRPAAHGATGDAGP